MEELKLIIAGNIGNLRREAGMTQIELAERLSYSDKAVSKWERGESIPDVVTLKLIADCFNVSVDYLLRPDHPVETEIKRDYTRRQKRNHRLITVMACVTVWLIAAIIYSSVDIVVSSQERQYLWLAFAYSVPITLVVLLVFNSIWGNRRYNFAIISGLIWTFLACAFLSSLLLFEYGFWLLFVIGIPAQIIVFLWSGLRYH